MNDPWIVVYTEGYTKKKETELIYLATTLLGMVQVGFVDIDDPDCDELIEAKVITVSLYVISFLYVPVVSAIVENGNTTVLSPQI